jgi:3-oxoacyl-[acyl-carrier protein] reductase
MSKTAIITGGTRGIGLGIARSLRDEGYKLVLCGVRDDSAVSDILCELRNGGAELLYVQADVSQSADRQRLIDATRTRFGQLNVLVNNAGVAPRTRSDLLEATEESYDWVMGINLKGPYFLTQLAANWMIEQKQADSSVRCCIVNISSVSAVMATPARGEYCLSKAGMSMATVLWASRLGEYDIPVYEVRPGITATDMTSGVKEKYDRLIAEGLCVQPRWGRPEDTGNVVAMMARGDLAYSTGQVINVEGGMLLQRL